MEQTKNSSFAGALIAVVGFAGTLIGLLADVPEIFNNTLGKIGLAIIFIGSVTYLAYFVYTNLYLKVVKELQETKKKMEQLNRLIVTFISVNSVTENLTDPELINVIVSTKKMRDIPIHILGTRYLDDRIEVTIDKGHKHGFMEGMQFKIFHNNQMIEIGTCSCTPAYDQTTLAVPINAACPIAPRDIHDETIEIRLIEPLDNSKINNLLANLLYELDH